MAIVREGRPTGCFWGPWYLKPTDTGLIAHTLGRLRLHRLYDKLGVAVIVGWQTCTQRFKETCKSVCNSDMNSWSEWGFFSLLIARAHTQSDPMTRIASRLRLALRPQKAVKPSFGFRFVCDGARSLTGRPLQRRPVFNERLNRLFLGLLKP